jgi:hypothetical protein
MKYLEITNKYNEEIKKINKKYINDLNSISNDITNAKINYKKTILSPIYDLSFLSLSELTKHNFEFDIYNIIEKKETPSKIVKSNFIKKVVLANKKNQEDNKIINLSYNNIQKKDKINNISLINSEILNKFRTRIKTKKTEIKPVEFNLNIKDKKENIIIYDQEKINNILPY